MAQIFEHRKESVFRGYLAREECLERDRQHLHMENSVRLFYSLFLALRVKYVEEPDETLPSSYFNPIKDLVSRIIGMQPKPALRPLSFASRSITDANLFRLHAGVLVMIKVRTFFLRH